MSRGSATWDAGECVLILIDYQPEMLNSVRSGDVNSIEKNVSALARAAVAFDIPIILSTVGVKMGVNQGTIAALKSELPSVHEIDRSTMNAWEDDAFLKAVESTGRRRLVMCGLWTEICLAYPVVEALEDDYEVCFVVDAIGGQSKEEHETAIQRMVQARAVPNTSVALISEWFRDWKSPRANRGREILKALIHEHHNAQRNLDTYESPSDSYSSQSDMI
ncbi:MAG: isochorismatase family protein [Bacillota bacterium]